MVRDHLKAFLEHLRLNENASAHTVRAYDSDLSQYLAFLSAHLERRVSALTPADLESFLAAQPDLSPKAWPRYVRITADLPTTATHKVLKRELAAQGATPGDGELWVREPRGTLYSLPT